MPIRKSMERPELSATITVAAMLMAVILTKLNHAWLGIIIIIALCVFHLAQRQSRQ